MMRQSRIAACLLGVALSGGALGAPAGDNPFTRYARPNPEEGHLLPEEEIRLKSWRDKRYAKAEAFFAKGKYLEASGEYGREFGDAYDFGLLAEIVEHTLVSLVEVTSSDPSPLEVMRFSFPNGETRFVLVTSLSEDKKRVEMILVHADGSRREYRTALDGDDFSLPLGWRVRGRQPEMFSPRERLERLLTRFRSTHPLDFGHGYTVDMTLRAMRVREMWLSRQGRSDEEILAAYRDDCLRHPADVRWKDGPPVPSVIRP